jgi:hypothetical protein
MIVKLAIGVMLLDEVWMTTLVFLKLERMGYYIRDLIGVRCL